MSSTVGAGTPRIDETAYIAQGARLIGSVTVNAGASVWYNAVLRADTESITIGDRTNVQDLVAGHADPGFPLILGTGVTVGHGAVLHGCTIEDDVLIGMNATVLNGAVIRTGSMVAAGAVILGGSVIPPGSLVAGIPAKVRRSLTTDELAAIKQSAEEYAALAQRSRVTEPISTDISPM